jgi:hypothetical protein
MIELPLAYEGNGVFRATSRAAVLRAQQSCEQGETFKASLTRPRSVDQNNFFHGLIDAAWQNLQNDFSDPRHLKEWLLIEAGHVQEDRVLIDKMPRKHMRPVIEAMTASLRRRNTVVRVAYNEKYGELVMHYAGEWKFEKTGHDRATEITQKVVEIICERLLPGTTPDEVFAMADRQAHKGVNRGKWK